MFLLGWGIESSASDILRVKSSMRTLHWPTLPGEAMKPCQVSLAFISWFCTLISYYIRYNPDSCRALLLLYRDYSEVVCVVSCQVKRKGKNTE